MAGFARMSASAGVHGGHELDARGIGDAVIGPRDDGFPGLKRLA